MSPPKSQANPIDPGQRPLRFRTLILWRWKVFTGAMLAASVAQVVGIPLALLTRKMVKLVASEAGKEGSMEDVHAILFRLGAMLVGLSVLRGLARWVRNVLGEVFAQQSIAQLRKSMLKRVHYLSMGYFDRRAAGKVIIRFVGDALGLRGWLANRMVGIPADIITVICVIVAIASIDRGLCYAALLPIVLVLPLLLVLNPKSRSWTREGRKEQSRLTGNLTDRVRLMSDLKAANAQEASLEPLFERIDAVATAFIRRAFVDAWGRAVAITSGSLSICAVGIFGAVLILRGQQTSGDIVGAIWLAVLLRAPVNRLTSSNIAYQRVKVGFDRINALLSRKLEPGWDDKLEPYTGTEMRIRLRGVGYRDRHKHWILRDVTATLQGPGYFLIRGQKRATHTLCELILRIRRPQEGRIALDGTNARKLRVRDIRSRIGWVDAERRVVQSALITHSSEEIMDCLDKTEMLSSSSIESSELQHLQSFEQRARLHGARGLGLALACALVDDPPILLIDDPGANLGSKEKVEFQRWLRAESMSRLILVCTLETWLDSSAEAVLKLGPSDSSG